MDRYARGKHFERLCILRDAYAQRGDDDATSVISIEAVIAFASELLASEAAPALDADGDRTTSDR